MAALEELSATIIERGAGGLNAELCKRISNVHDGLWQLTYHAENERQRIAAAAAEIAARPIQLCEERYRDKAGPKDDAMGVFAESHLYVGRGRFTRQCVCLPRPQRVDQ